MWFSSPYTEGKKAYESGRDVMDCPREYSGKKADQWIQGWNDAHHADVMKQLNS